MNIVRFGPNQIIDHRIRVLFRSRGGNVIAENERQVEVRFGRRFPGGNGFAPTVGGVRKLPLAFITDGREFK